MTDPQQPSPVPPPTAPRQHQAAPPPPAYTATPRPEQPAHPQPVAPIHQTPPGAFAGPAGGYPAPYTSAARRTATPALGRIALVLALVAAVALTIVGAVLAWQIGSGVGSAADPTTLETQLAAGDLAVLTPVRQLVLWWEITAWSATAVGIWALVQGIVATVRRRGRGAGVAAVVIAAVGPIVFFVVCYLTMVIGLGISAAAR